MTNGRNGAGFGWAVIVVAALAGGGCFNPKIVDGGLRCADGGACPEGFTCAVDGTCKKGPTTCQPGSPPVTPLCTADPGTDCDPICQTRCPCGRCNLDGTMLKCVPPGTKKRGDICNPAADDCAPGNVCLSDCDKIARCYRFCGKGGINHDELCDGQACNFPVNDTSGNPTDLMVCPPPIVQCDPSGDGSDCGSTSLGCYLDGTRTVCDCRGKNQPGASCGVFNSCIAGYRCISIATVNNGAPTCLQTCTLGGTDCPSGTCTSAGGGSFGFCPP
jgi:hypothetical protein